MSTISHITSRKAETLKPVDFPEIDEIILKNNFRLSVQRVSGLYISRILDENNNLMAFASCPTICQSVTVAVRKIEQDLHDLNVRSLA